MYWKFPILYLYILQVYMNGIFGILITVNYKFQMLSNTHYQIIHFSIKYERLRIIIQIQSRIFKRNMNSEYFTSVVERGKNMEKHNTSQKSCCAVLNSKRLYQDYYSQPLICSSLSDKWKYKTNLFVCIISFAVFFIFHDWYDSTLYDEHVRWT